MAVTIVNEKQFLYAQMYGASIHTFCNNCNMIFSNECNRDPEEWIRATSQGVCGKCFEEIRFNELGEASV